LRLLRLPRAGISVSRRRVEAQKLADLDAEATLVVPVGDEPGAAQTTGERLSDDGELLGVGDTDPGPGTATRPLCEAEVAEGRALVASQSDRDLFLTVATADDRRALCRWFDAVGLRAPSAVAVPEGAEVALLFDGPEGRRRATHDAIVTGGVLVITVKPGPPWGGRLETLFVE
jgi:hypothetical protein